VFTIEKLIGQVLYLFYENETPACLFTCLFAANYIRANNFRLECGIRTVFELLLTQ